MKLLFSQYLRYKHRLEWADYMGSILSILSIVCVLPGFVSYMLITNTYDAPWAQIAQLIGIIAGVFAVLCLFSLLGSLDDPMFMSKYRHVYSDTFAAGDFIESQKLSDAVRNALESKRSDSLSCIVDDMKKQKASSRKYVTTVHGTRYGHPAFVFLITDSRHVVIGVKKHVIDTIQFEKSVEICFNAIVDLAPNSGAYSEQYL